LAARVPIGDVTAATRTAQVLALQDAKSTQPVSHMLLQLDNPTGGSDRIRVDVRGNVVGATIDVQDADSAAQLIGRSHELTQALEQRGLDSDPLRVRTLPSAPPLDVTRASSTGATALSRPDALLAAGSSSSSRSRGDSPRPRPQSDPSRNRSRREQQGDKS
jgi:hypothetical protein